MFILPMDRDTEKIFYNQRIIVDNHVLTEPRAWKISKINRLTSNGVVIVTCGQDKFNPDSDYLDPSDGYWWADFFNPTTGQESVQNQSEPIDDIYGIISMIGSQNIKVHGSYKKLTISYFNGDESIEPLQGNWHFYIDGQDATTLIQTKTDGLSFNEIKVKFLGDPIYIGKELIAYYTPLIGERVEFKIPVVSL